MRITIEVAAETVMDVLRLTGERKKSPALAKAAVEYVARRKAEEFGRLLREGAFNYPSTNEEIERAEEAEHGAG